jgi:hypothetical protein
VKVAGELVVEGTGCDLSRGAPRGARHIWLRIVIMVADCAWPPRAPGNLVSVWLRAVPAGPRSASDPPVIQVVPPVPWPAGTRR